MLTASGGPFRGRAASNLESVSPADALKHPTWRMGRKITIDSATLMNKGLEVIEARWLFGVRPSQIDVVVHPQSVIHSMVELTDGSVIAQLGITDMRMPIQYAFSYPDRWPATLPSLDLVRAGRLEFEEADTVAFPCLRLAYDALNGAAQRRRGSQRGERSGRGEVPRWTAGLPGDSGDRSSGRWTITRPRRLSLWHEVRALDAWAREYAPSSSPTG